MTDPAGVPSAARLLELVDGMAGRPVLMLVDLVADRFIYGSPKRISREAPVLILSYDGEQLSPGGGATPWPTSRHSAASPCRSAWSITKSL